MLTLPQPPDTCINDCAVSFWVDVPILDTKCPHTLLQNYKGFGGIGVIDKTGKRMFCYDETNGRAVDCGIDFGHLKHGWHHIVINLYNNDL